MIKQQELEVVCEKGVGLSKVIIDGVSYVTSRDSDAFALANKIALNAAIVNSAINIVNLQGVDLTRFTQELSSLSKLISRLTPERKDVERRLESLQTSIIERNEKAIREVDGELIDQYHEQRKLLEQLARRESR